MFKFKIFYLGLILIILCTGCTSSIQTKRLKVINTALQQLGKNYKKGGIDPNVGFDCSGLVYYSYRVSGYKIPRTVKLQYAYSKKVYFFKKPGDLLFFNINKRWWNLKSYFNVDHVGIYLGNNKMIHSPRTGSKVTIVSDVFNNRFWRKRYYNTRRVIY